MISAAGAALAFCYDYSFSLGIGGMAYAFYNRVSAPTYNFTLTNLVRFNANAVVGSVEASLESIAHKLATKILGNVLRSFNDLQLPALNAGNVDSFRRELETVINNLNQKNIKTKIPTMGNALDQVQQTIAKKSTVQLVTEKVQESAAYRWWSGELDKTPAQRVTDVTAAYKQFHELISKYHDRGIDSIILNQTDYSVYEFVYTSSANPPITIQNVDAYQTNLEEIISRLNCRGIKAQIPTIEQELMTIWQALDNEKEFPNSWIAWPSFVGSVTRSWSQWYYAQPKTPPLVQQQNLLQEEVTKLTNGFTQLNSYILNLPYADKKYLCTQPCNSLKVAIFKTLVKHELKVLTFNSATALALGTIALGMVGIIGFKTMMIASGIFYMVRAIADRSLDSSLMKEAFHHVACRGGTKEDALNLGMIALGILGIFNFNILTIADGISRIGIIAGGIFYAVRTKYSPHTEKAIHNAACWGSTKAAYIYLHLRASGNETTMEAITNSFKLLFSGQTEWKPTFLAVYDFVIFKNHLVTPHMLCTTAL